MGTRSPHLHLMLWRITEEPSRLPLVPGAEPRSWEESSRTELELPEEPDVDCLAAWRWRMASFWSSSSISRRLNASGTTTITWPSQWGQRPFLPAYLSLTLKTCPFWYSTLIPILCRPPLPPTA